ncbi:MAG: FliG C-terminal domain-containing protein [Candidatus Riflemargulisbacteria bacterium]
MVKAKNLLLLGLFILYIFVPVNAEVLLDNQKHLELTVQSALDRILGPDNSIVYISLVGDSEKWEIRYTSLPQIDGMDARGGGGSSQQTVAPGIPSLRFLTQGSSGEGVPLNYEIVQSPPVIRNKDVVLILDNKIKMGDLRSARTFVTKFLALDENAGDKLTILRENFSTLQKSEKSASSVTSKKKNDWTPIIVIAVIVLLLLIIGIVLLKILPSKAKKDGAGLGEEGSGEEKAAAAGSAKGAASGAGAGSGGGGEGSGGGAAGGEGADGSGSDAGGHMTAAEKLKKAEEIKKKQEDEIKKQEEEAKLVEMQKGILGNGERFFNFIDEENVFKLKFLLQVKIALQQATPRTIAVVMSCLPFKLASSILVEYPPKIQAEIANSIMVLQHYPDNDMQQLENEIKENIEYLFGGRNRLRLIIERIPGEDKKKILDIISSKYPGISDEVNALIFLFDDLLKLDIAVITRVFSDIDTEVIATALVHIEPEAQRKVVKTLAKGVQAMVDQWLALKSSTASRSDVEEARQKVLSYAQHLEREGFIEL